MGILKKAAFARINRLKIAKQCNEMEFDFCLGGCRKCPREQPNVAGAFARVELIPITVKLLERFGVF